MSSFALLAFFGISSAFNAVWECTYEFSDLFEAAESERVEYSRLLDSAPV